MALIGTIRKNGWILIVMMTLALGGFILMEIISNVQRNQAGDVNTMGKVNGQEINRQEFEVYQSLIYTNAKSNPYQVRSQVWDFFVENALVQQEAEEIGLGVGPEELNDLQFGNNLSPIVVTRYGENGQVDRATLSQIKAALESDQIRPEFKQTWAEQVKEITKQALEDKITDLVAKGMYTPSWQAEMVYRENNERVDFAYVRIPFEKVAENEIQVNDDDYKAYLEEFPRLHEQKEEGRIVNYVVFNVVPTAQDTQSARKAVEDHIERLRTTENDSSYVTLNDGVYDDSYKSKADLPPVVADTLLRLPLGSIVGPYLDGGVWSIAKILDRKVVPDSVRARHILLQGNTQNPMLAQQIDSLHTLLKNGARFDSLAIANSQDQGSAIKGGDLGFMSEGQTVPEFNTVLFFKGEPGKIYKVATQYGWHLIEITDRKFIKNETGVKAVYLSQRVEPGKETQNAVKDQAMSLYQQSGNIDELTTLAGQQNLPVQTSSVLKSADYNVGAGGQQLGADQGSRDIVRWAFDKKTEVGNVAKEVFVFRDPAGGYFDAKYVVAALKAVIDEGAPSIATLKSLPEVEAKVKNRKRADVIIAKLAGTSDLGAAAQAYGVAIDTARGSSFMQAGGEARVVGTVFSLPKDQVSKPIPGSSGVYLVKPVSDKPEAQLPPDLTMFRRQANSTAVTFVRRELLTAMKKDADIRDNRTYLGY
jgi:peptidyl-prolyl cis-trans isomerase D